MDMHVGDAQRRKPSSSTSRLSLDLDLDLARIGAPNARRQPLTSRGKLLPNILTNCVILGEMTSWDFPPPVAETSTSPDRERHADRAVIFAFSCYARIARYIQSIGLEFARRGSTTGFSVNPLLFPAMRRVPGRLSERLETHAQQMKLEVLGHLHNRAPFSLTVIPKFEILGHLH